VVVRVEVRVTVGLGEPVGVLEGRKPGGVAVIVGVAVGVAVRVGVPVRVPVAVRVGLLDGRGVNERVMVRVGRLVGEIQPAGSVRLFLELRRNGIASPPNTETTRIITRTTSLIFDDLTLSLKSLFAEVQGRQRGSCGPVKRIAEDASWISLESLTPTAISIAFFWREGNCIKGIWECFLVVGGAKHPQTTRKHSQIPGPSSYPYN
jgi:hypothetical protein